MAVWGKYPEGKKGREMKRSHTAGGKTEVVLPTSSPAGWGFCRDLLDQKSKSLLFPGAGGAWLQMTSAL